MVKRLLDPNALGKYMYIKSFNNCAIITVPDKKFQEFDHTYLDYLDTE